MRTFFAALLASAAIFTSFTSAAYADEASSPAAGCTPPVQKQFVQVGIDTGLMQIGPNPMVTVNRIFVTVPLFERDKGGVKLEVAKLLIGDPNYHTYTTSLDFDFKTRSGVIFEARVGVAKVSTSVTESTMAGTTTSTVSTSSSTYGVGVLYRVDDVTFSAKADLINGYQPSYSFVGGISGEQQAHLVTVGAAYSF